jgi:hypothetical protein
MTATTLGVQPTGLTGRGRSGGDAPERAATNPVAARPYASTPLPEPLSIPLLNPLLIPSTATVGAATPAAAPFQQVRGTDPALPQKKPPSARPGSRGKQTARRTTGSRLHAGAFVSGRPPTNTVGGLPAGSPSHPYHVGWWDG